MLARTASWKKLRQVVLQVGREQILDRRTNQIDDGAQVPGLVFLGPLQLLQGCLDGAAVRMPEDHHESRSELFGGELDAADLRRGDDVAGDADHEQIAEPLIEDDFHGHARIGTAKNDRERLLARGEFDAAGAARQRVAAAHVLDESPIAVEEQSERVSGGDHRFRRFSVGAAWRD